MVVPSVVCMAGVRATSARHIKAVLRPTRLLDTRRTGGPGAAAPAHASPASATLPWPVVTAWVSVAAASTQSIEPAGHEGREEDGQEPDHLKCRGRRRRDHPARDHGQHDALVVPRRPSTRRASCAGPGSSVTTAHDRWPIAASCAARGTRTPRNEPACRGGRPGPSPRSAERSRQEPRSHRPPRNHGRRLGISCLRTPGCSCG